MDRKRNPAPGCNALSVDGGFGSDPASGNPKSQGRRESPELLCDPPKANLLALPQTQSSPIRGKPRLVSREIARSSWLREDHWAFGARARPSRAAIFTKS